MHRQASAAAGDDDNNNDDNNDEFRIDTKPPHCRGFVRWGCDVLAPVTDAGALEILSQHVLKIC